MKKRGQFWYTDYLIGLLVFMIIGFLFFRTVVDISTSNALLEILVEEGVTISNALMSEGYKHNLWASGDGRIGFVDEGKVNKTHYDLFKTLTSTTDGYQTSKYLIGTRYDYVTYFEDEDGIQIGQISGDPQYNIKDKEAIVKFVRFVWYDEDSNGQGILVRLIVEVWQ